MGKGIFDYNIRIVTAFYVRELLIVKVIDFRLREVPDIFIEDFLTKVVEIVNEFMMHLSGFYYLQGPGASYPGVKNRKVE